MLYVVVGYFNKLYHSDRCVLNVSYRYFKQTITNQSLERTNDRIAKVLVTLIIKLVVACSIPATGEYWYYEYECLYVFK